MVVFRPDTNRHVVTNARMIDGNYGDKHLPWNVLSVDLVIAQRIQGPKQTPHVFISHGSDEVEHALSK